MSGVGITFDETHSFRDWGLKLKKIEIGIPKAKTEYVRNIFYFITFVQVSKGVSPKFCVKSRQL